MPALIGSILMGWSVGGMAVWLGGPEWLGMAVAGGVTFGLLAYREGRV